MTDSVLDIRNRLMPRLPARPVSVRGDAAKPPAPPRPVFVHENPNTGRTLITVPAEKAREGIVASDFLLRLTGRLVEAEKANGNGAFWTHEDLTYGLASVSHGPLNWLHEERKVIGTLTQAQLVDREAAAAVQMGPHISADSMVWRWLYPREAAMIEEASDSRGLYYSMECISREVACVGDGGCGATVSYLDALRKTEKACVHIRERAAARRFINPIFQGAAVIVPPVKPGWANADVTIQRQAAQLVEDQELQMPGLSEAAAAAMVAQVMEYAARP